ncbi:MAG: dihydroorotate dehydrogenase electron transfer subunit [Clostridiales bacterium]|nr:dihydroorotate dehydrogenase electron transfer subunit [Clostridiales bacterium]
MSDRRKKSVEILENVCLTSGIYSMRIKDNEIAGMAKPGQFVSLYTKDSSKLLPRPISICDITEDTVRLVYRVSGEGTKQFSKLVPGDMIDVIGPLGNGYDLDELNKNNNGRLTVVGGGIGIPPMLYLAKEYIRLFPDRKVTAVLGFRDKNTFLTDEFEKVCDVLYASDSGEIGIKGNVIDVIRNESLEMGIVCACGPTPMLRGLVSYTNEKNIDTYISLEEKMACGIGACLACVCKTTEIDSHSNVYNKRICKDGPVFKSTDIEL